MQYLRRNSMYQVAIYSSNIAKQISVLAAFIIEKCSYLEDDFIKNSLDETENIYFKAGRVGQTKPKSAILIHLTIGELSRG